MKKQKQYTRREVIKALGLGTLAALSSPNPIFASQNKLLSSTADTVILLWMAGGMPHTETFDPKKYQEFAKGLSSKKVLSTFKQIDSNVDHIKLSAGLENLSSVMDKATIVRSLVGPDLGAVLHTRHQYHWHTGYIPPQTLPVPHIGSSISKTLKRLNSDLPSFFEIGQKIEGDGAAEINSFMTSGFLGLDHEPFRIPYPSEAMSRVNYPPNFSKERFQNRNKLFQKMIKESPFNSLASNHQKEAMLNSINTADRLLNSKSKKAFDLSLEPKESYDKYNTSRFGRGCLLARRLAEEGTRFIEVSSDYKAFGNWDTHNHGHSRTIELKRWIDQPVAQLIKDLDERGMLDRTLVVIATEFSRVAGKNPGSNAKKATKDVIITNEKQYGLHRHFKDASSVVMFGGGIKGGFVYGKTEDEFPCKAVENKVEVQDIHATIFRALGIPADLSYDFEERPVYLTEDGKGKVIEDLFSNLG